MFIVYFPVVAGGAALIFTAGTAAVSVVAPGAVAGVAGAAGAGASMLPIALGIFGIGIIKQAEKL